MCDEILSPFSPSVIRVSVALIVYTASLFVVTTQEHIAN